MKKLFVFLTVFGVCCLFFITPVHAYTLGFSPNSQTVNVLDSFSVDLVATLGTGESFDKFGTTIYAFDFDVIEASLATVPAPFTLTVPVDYRSHDNIGFVDIFAGASTAQTGTITLATINFVAKDIGTATLGFETTVLFLGGEWLTGTKQGGSVTVGSTAVPEPSTLLFLASGLVGIVGLKKRMK